MKYTLHQTHHNVADLKESFQYLKESLHKKTPGIHVYPELSLTGYPLQDVCLQIPFIESYCYEWQQFCDWLESQPADDSSVHLVGGISYEISENNIPLELKNSVFACKLGGRPTKVTDKKLLPNYDIFDELKYFRSGDDLGLFEFQGRNFIVLVCEDMWSSSFHHQDPVANLVEHLKQNPLEISAVINLSASPYIRGKVHERKRRSHEIANFFQAPFIYVNRVGGEDEILFDGGSFVVDGKSTIKDLPLFSKAVETIVLTTSKLSFSAPLDRPIPNTWEELFKTRLYGGKTRLDELSDYDGEELIWALNFGVQEYAKKSGFSHFLVALSGGIDSALVLTLLKLGLKEGQSIEAIYMPSQFSKALSYDLSFELCQNLKVPLKTLPIKFLHSAVRNQFRDNFSEAFEGLADENVQSRLRGMLLYARSNQSGRMVINTSNKSEIAVGYSTQYGDSVGAISMLGDLYKTEVYELAKYINRAHGELIPKGIIERPASAELRENQKDTDSLPSYDVLDAILEGVLSNRYSYKNLIDQGFEEAEVKKVFDLYRRSEYKRFQFAPIIKVSAKSFGFGHRVPMSKKSDFYFRKNQ